MGAPTKYNDETLEKTKDYVINYKDLGDSIPSLAGLAYQLEITKETVIQWMKDENKDEFSYHASKIATNQERALINGGLNGEYNPSIAKLLLHAHGHSDKSEITGKDGEPLYVPIIKRFDGTMDEDE